MKLWCYVDAQYRGSALCDDARKRGIDARLFEHPRMPDDGYVYVHMNAHPSVRFGLKRVTQTLSLNPNIVMIPDYRSSVLFDNKIEQCRQLSRWTPATKIFYTPKAARSFLEHEATFPIVSRTSEGSGQARLIGSAAEAHDEVRYSFSDIGLRVRQAARQQGFLIWQQYLPGNEYDVRVVAIGSQRVLLKRYLQKDRPLYVRRVEQVPINDQLDDALKQALQFANAIFQREDMSYAAADVMYDSKLNRWRLADVTCAWPIEPQTHCRVTDSHTRLLDELEAGNFDPNKTGII